MLKVGDIVKHNQITFNNTPNPLLGIVEKIDGSCHVRTCTCIQFDVSSCVYIMKHENYTYVGQDHLEHYWRLVC